MNASIWTEMGILGYLFIINLIGTAIWLISEARKAPEDPEYKNQTPEDEDSGDRSGNSH